MSLIPCDACRSRVPEKLAQTTWAWYTADGHRTAWRQRLCTACWASTVATLDHELNFDALTCPCCGISVEKDLDAVYITSYVPGQGKQQLEVPTCPACAVNVRARAQVGAQKLEDRRVEGPSDSGPSTLTTRESYWSSLGIGPKAADE